MSTSEKVAYLKGLFEGMQFKPDSNETKLFKTIIDVLEDISHDVEDIEENSLDLGEEIDELSDDLALIEDLIYEGFEDIMDEDDEHCGHDHHHGHGGCCGHDHDDEPLFFDVECPSCKNEITIDEDVVELGSIECPNCGEKLEFYFDDIEDEETEEEKK